MKYILFVITFILVSCAEKPQTALKVSIGAIGTNTNFDGGLVLLGKSNNGFRVSKVVPLGDSAEIYLPNGTWNFAVIGWDAGFGGAIMQGASYCAFKQGVSLNGADIILNMNATTANCINPMFGGNMDVANAQMFQPIEITSCTDINRWINYYGISNIPDGLNCNGGEQPLPGEFKSFKVIIPEAIAGNNQLLTGGGLNSACLKNNTAPFHNVTTILRLPKGSAQVPVPYIIQAFSDNTCAGSGYMKEFRFINGLTDFAQNNKAASKYDEQLNGGSNKGRRILLNSVPCNADMLAAQTGDFPISTASANPNSYLICNADDLSKVAAGTNDTDGVYYLGRNINMNDHTGGASGFSWITNFAGVFNGNGHTISNGVHPLFNNIVNGSTDVFISNFTLDNFNIDANENDNGILANIVNGSSTNRVEIEGIKIINSSITNDSNGADIGGMVGQVSMSASSADNYYFRNNEIQVDIDASSGNNNQNIGGMIGVAIGNNSYSVVLEHNFIGVNKRNDLSDRTKASSIQYSAGTLTASSVGGLIGNSTDTEIRDGNIVIADISAEQNVGGMVGVVIDGTKIENSYADLLYSTINSCGNASYTILVSNTTNSVICNSIGGAVGKANPNADLKINGAKTKLVISNNSGVVDAVGGLIGFYEDTASNFHIKVQDSKADLDVTTDGKHHGGFFGIIVATNTGGDDTVKRSVAIGDLANASSGNQNFKGGFAGFSKNATYSMNIADLNISGKQYLAGGIGMSSGTTVIHESHLLGSVTSSITSLEQNGYAYTAGGIGYIDTVGTDSEPNISWSKIDVKINATGLSLGSGGNYDHFIGMAFGFAPDYTPGNDVNEKEAVADSLIVGEIKDSSGNLINNPQNYACGKFNDTSLFQNSGISKNCTGAVAFDTSSSNDANCTGLAGPFDTFDSVFDSKGTICQPLFSIKWQESGYQNSTFLAGSKFEPFPISSPDDWNAIKTDEFLLSKTFELTQNVSFDGQDFLPIGVRYEDDTGIDITDVENAFEGQILSNGYKLMDIELSPTNVDSETGIGVIHAMTKDARLGDRHEPFVIENLNIECSQSGGCGIVSYAHQARLYVDARNVTISAGVSGLNCMGGLIGYISDDTSNGAVVEIENSRFVGAVNGYDATNSANGVGGLVGCVGDGLNQSEQLTIKQTAVNLKALKGNDNIGGMIGTVYNDITSIGINESYINFVADNNYSPQISCDSCNGTDDKYAGFVGSPGSTLINLVDVFIDTSQATFDTTNDFNIAFGFGSAVGDAAQERIAYIFPAGYTDTDESLTLPGNAGTKLFEATSQANLDTANNGVNDINLSNEFVPVNGLYKLDWEINGHHN